MDPDDHEPTGAPVPEYRARRELTALETKRVISELLLRVEDHADLSMLKHGSLTAVSKLFHVSARTFNRSWQRAIENLENPHVAVLRASPNKNRLARNKFKTSLSFMRFKICRILASVCFYTSLANTYVSYDFVDNVIIPRTEKLSRTRKPSSS